MRQLIRKHVQDTFEVNKTSLPTILADIRDGRLQLPNLQRTWRWPDEHIISLLESIAVNHPVGAIMAIETGGELKFQHRGFEGTDVNLADKVTPTHLMLDGQQRCTSLLQACFSDRPVKVESEKRAKYRRYFFDMEKALYVAGPLSDAIISLTVDWQGVPVRRDGNDLTDEAVQFSELVFPVNEMFRFSDWDRRFHAYWDADGLDRQKASEARQTARDFHSVIVQAFTTCMIPVIMLRRGMTVAGVCKVYENLNSKGVPLDAFDLLIAHFAAEGYCLRTDWFGPRGQPGTQKVLENIGKGILDDIDAKQFMQAVLLAHGLSVGQDIGIEKDDLLSLKLDAYLANREAVIEGFAEASEFLREDRVYSSKTAPSMLYIICLAAIFAHLGSEGKDEKVREKLRRWLWTSALSSSYGAHSTRVMAEAVPVVVEWILRGGPEPDNIVSPIVTFGDIKNAKKGGTVYKAIVATILRQNPEDPTTGLPLLPEHLEGKEAEEVSVFPVAWCKANGITAEISESIVNRILVSPKLRDKWGKTAPSETLDNLELDNDGLSFGEIEARLASQGANAAALCEDDFKDFVEMRLKWLASMVESVTGSRVISDDDIRALQARASAVAPTDEEFVPEGYTWRSSSRGGTAFMKACADGFIVMAGSVMSPDATPSLDHRFAVEREDMISNGILRQEDDGSWLLLEDCHFPSPSHAYSVFTGQKAVGRIWKDSDGNHANPSVALKHETDEGAECDQPSAGDLDEFQSLHLWSSEDRPPDTAISSSEDDVDDEDEDSVDDDNDDTSSDKNQNFALVLEGIETILGDELVKVEGRSHYRTKSGRGVKFIGTGKYKGSDFKWFIKVRPEHFEDEYLVIWKHYGGGGWMIPSSKLRDFLECIPMSGRAEGVQSWDPRLKTVDGQHYLWTHEEDFGTLDITTFAFTV